ncbi:protein-L-isoaspartate O-methyltransferase [Phytophthora nicotianae CJ01A1]|uniref:Protein-L-isoaspartate O-methyltransferase n=6 Tax=Phytophthora nicotianae TaxID=4792 RepID=W2Q6P0_PHYN3|nr:protein-L-isoaspartate O-methyltransferase [Phytophthora nicotianae INRA-310]ETI46544.1 protein-L-isoaspartate O-methyltransferase [Phytophthora nicotianae P1569]ETK86474.1 protein-L-isoaspartate O-methyltransferase [Phytophthora nicotianae]ETO75241.1 protein-L-isoaspartate O-methyltransferase [Phytophthora nicotianae P1976]ETP16337.1 protein-L-isoaspartate O-methyltransferase [Phytophthora nicotianae CJ01A1]ETP44390.1 protein-L-isoaspartate O-methyltransferase [Phytophthora nicotianae P102
MAWRCSALSNDGLVDNLARAGIVQSQRVIRAMKATDRAQYVTSPSESGDPETRSVSPAQAYQDAPQRLGYEQTISAPHMHAYALELADVALHSIEHPRVLDVGAGSGYLTACLGHLVDQEGGRVFGIERIPQLAQLAKRNIERADGDLVRRGVVSVERADGWTGLPNEAPFHFIHVGAAAVEPPRALMEQLAEGGRLVVPVGEQGANQVLMEIQRTDKETFTRRELMGVSYVPLVRQRTEL